MNRLENFKKSAINMREKKHCFLRAGVAFLFVLFFMTSTAMAQNTEELAKELVNPVSSLISVPFQFNYDSNIGANDKGERFLLNIQPVLPFSLNENWNLISRTIVPVISQDDVVLGEGSQFGVGDIVQSFFFSPKKPTKSGWIWGAGPVFVLPTASDDLLGADKWAGGITGVVFKQKGPWSYGVLVNHVWSLAGDDKRPDYSSSYMQPFLSYTTETATTFSINTEATYEWKSSQSSIPVSVSISHIFKIGKQLVNIGGGIRYWAKSADNGPEGWGARFNIVLLFPK